MKKSILFLLSFFILTVTYAGAFNRGKFSTHEEEQAFVKKLYEKRENITLEDARLMNGYECNGWYEGDGAAAPWDCNCVIVRIFDTNTEEENQLFIYKWTFLQNNRWVEWNKKPESERIDEIETRATKYCIEVMKHSIADKKMTSNHLHFEVRTNQNHSTQTSRAGKLWGQDIDPVRFLRQQGHRL